MTVFGAYLLAPVLLAVACLGAGLWIAALRPRIALGALTAPAGMAIIVVLGVVMTYSASTARWTTPVICGVAVLGLPLFAWSRRTTLPSLVRGLDWWPLAVAAAAFVSFAASVAMSGEASWAGWIKLDDTATWLGFTDQLMTAGRAIPEPMTSTFERLIDVNFRGTYGGTGATAYPVGAFPPLGVMSQLAGGDVAWLIHPYMSLLGALLALSLYRLLGAVIGLRWFRALASVVAAQGATLLAYVLWGGIKEILLAMLLTVVAIAVAEASMRGSGWRALVLPVVACLAFLGSTGTPGVGYLAPILIGGLLLGWIVRRPRSGWIATAAVMSAGVTAGVLAVGGLLRPRLSGVPEINDIGNLIAPLNPWQSVGIWLTADFRYSPEYPVATTVLIIIAVALAAVGLVAAVRERSWALPLLVGSNLLVLAYSQVSGGAWLAGKAMAVASPAILAAALAGAAAIGRRLRPLAPDPATSSAPVARGWRVCAAGLAAAVILGVLWSNALAYKSVWLAPAAQQAELEAIGREFAGQGPALMTDFSIFGGRHFLRELDTEVAAELRVHEIPLRDGSIGYKGQTFDVSAFPPSTLEEYPLLVLRRAPLGARPPANYERVRAGRYYDVWRRIPGSAAMTTEIPLTGQFAIPAADSCAAIAQRSLRTGLGVPGRGTVGRRHPGLPRQRCAPRGLAHRQHG